MTRAEAESMPYTSADRARTWGSGFRRSIFAFDGRWHVKRYEHPTGSKWHIAMSGEVPDDLFVSGSTLREKLKEAK